MLGDRSRSLKKPFSLIFASRCSVVANSRKQRPHKKASIVSMFFQFLLLAREWWPIRGMLGLMGHVGMHFFLALCLLIQACCTRRHQYLPFLLLAREWWPIRCIYACFSKHFACILAAFCEQFATIAHDTSTGNTSAHDPSTGNTSTHDPSTGNTSTHDPSTGDTSAYDPSTGNTSARDPDPTTHDSGRRTREAYRIILGTKQYRSWGLHSCWGRRKLDFGGVPWGSTCCSVQFCLACKFRCLITLLQATQCTPNGTFIPQRILASMRFR